MKRILLILIIALLPACSELEVTPDKAKDDDKERGILIDTTKDKD